MIVESLVGWVTDFIITHPHGVIILIVVITLARLANTVHGPAPEWRDPQRAYTREQRFEIRDRAGGRCEHKAPLLPRCSRSGAQADHVFPWSRGGSTTVENGQWLCAEHNRMKTNHMPTRLSVWRLTRRRRSYFPPGVDPSVTAMPRHR